MTDDPEIAALLQSALENCVVDDEDPDDADDARFSKFLAAASGLRDCGSSAAFAVRRLFDEGDARGRAVAAYLLGRMTFQAEPAMHDQYLSLLEAMLCTEQAGPDETAVVEAIATSFGHLEDSRALPALLSLAGHPSAEVRFSAAAAIPRACGFAARPEAVEVLLRLTADPDSDVRDWACFGLGQLEADGPRVRDALAARLDDPDVDTRCEALTALAVTGDPRAYAKLVERLAAGDLSTLEIEAAGELADPRLRAALQQLEHDWRDEEDFDVFKWPLERAIARCDPGQRPAADAIEARLEADLCGAPQLVAEGLTVSREGRYPHTRLIFRDGDGGIKLSSRVWAYDEPLTFNYSQQRDSYLLTLSGSR